MFKMVSPTEKENIKDITNQVSQTYKESSKAPEPMHGKHNKQSANVSNCYMN